MAAVIDNVHVRLIFDLDKKKAKMPELVKLQNLVTKCCKIQKI